MYKLTPKVIQWIFTAIGDFPMLIGQYKSGSDTLITELIIEYVLMNEFNTLSDIKVLVNRYIRENL